jgi:streptogramin lyase
MRESTRTTVPTPSAIEPLEPRWMLSAKTPTFTEIPLATGASPQKAVVGGDGSVYVYESGINRVARQRPNNKPYTEFSIPTESNQHFGMAKSNQGDIFFTIDGGIESYSPKNGLLTPHDLTADVADMAPASDNNLWFTLPDTNQIGRFILKGSKGHPTGEFTKFDVPTASAGLASITTGPKNDLWFSENLVGKIGHVILGKNGAAPTIEEFDVPTPNSHVVGMTKGPDGNIWFTETFADKIGVINEKTHAITEFNVPTANAGPFWITTGPDKALWFVERDSGKVGRITTSGSITEFDTPSGSNAVLTSIVKNNNRTLWYTAAGTDKVGKITGI